MTPRELRDVLNTADEFVGAFTIALTFYLPRVGDFWQFVETMKRAGRLLEDFEAVERETK